MWKTLVFLYLFIPILPLLFFPSQWKEFLLKSIVMEIIHSSRNGSTQEQAASTHEVEKKRRRNQQRSNLILLHVGKRDFLSLLLFNGKILNINVHEFVMYINPVNGSHAHRIHVATLFLFLFILFFLDIYISCYFFHPPEKIFTRNIK